MYQPCKIKEGFYGGLSRNSKPVSMPVQCIYIDYLLSILVPVAANPILESVEHLVWLCILIGKREVPRGAVHAKAKRGKI
jgi:hypothetical protein